jgi:Sulfotransferase domain
VTNVFPQGKEVFGERSGSNGCYRGKVFGIGLSRTGTASLHLALGILGFRSIHCPNLEHLRELVDLHDAAVDTPVACSFRELDELHPDSRFILTIRDFRSWLKSTEAFFGAREPAEPWKRQLRMKTYGVLTWERGAFLRAYHRHVETVLEHFANRPRDLLILNIVGGEGWEPVCVFLGKIAPPVAFPHAHSHADQ